MDQTGLLILACLPPAPDLDPWKWWTPGTFPRLLTPAGCGYVRPFSLQGLQTFLHRNASLLHQKRVGDGVLEWVTVQPAVCVGCHICWGLVLVPFHVEEDFD